MKNIVTVTFNPAVDKSTSVEQLVAEHKMSATEPLYQPGGGGVNIVRALKKLGVSATALYFQGGKTGEFFSDLLRAEEVDAIPISISGSMRENFVVNERCSGKQFRFGLPGPEISDIEQAVLFSRLESIDSIDFLVVSGSLSTGIPLDVFKTLKAIAESKNAKLVVDTSEKALESALSSGVFLIKPSIRELASLAGKKHLSASQAVGVAKEIIQSGRCEVIVVSMGERGAILVTNDIISEVVAPRVNVVSTVGAGDSLLAGILLSLAKDKDFISALQYGIACGSAATLKPGTGLCDKKSADKFLKIIQDLNGKNLS